MDNALIKNLITIIENQQKRIDSLSEEVSNLQKIYSHKLIPQMDKINNLSEHLKLTQQFTQANGNAISNVADLVKKLYNIYNLPHITKPKVEYEMNLVLKDGYCGIDKNSGRKEKLIVSLTSFPDRMYDIKYTLYSLLTQTLKPDMIILWLAEEQFPNKEGDISDEILSLKKYGLSIKWCEDLKSYKKLIPSLREFPDDIIITADDDMYYYKEWLSDLYSSYKEYPNFIHTFSTNTVVIADNKLDGFSFKDKPPKNAAFGLIICGGYGNLYPPHSLYKDMLNIKLIKELSPYEDDLWIWAMAVMNNTKIKTVPAMKSHNNFDKVKVVSPERQLLFNDDFCIVRLNSNTLELKNTFNKILKYYPEIEQKVLNEINTVTP